MDFGWALFGSCEVYYGRILRKSSPKSCWLNKKSYICSVFFNSINNQRGVNTYKFGLTSKLK